ncbi:unnamed protein product [Urochloa humidicola]
MEKIVSDLTDLVKKMQEDRITDRAADREAVRTLQQSLDANTVVMKDVVKLCPLVDSKVDELKSCLSDLQLKVDKLASKQEEFENPAYKVFDREDIDITKLKPVAAHLAASSFEGASGPDGHCSPSDYWGPGLGVVTTLVPSPVTGSKFFSKLTPVSVVGTTAVQMFSNSTNECILFFRKPRVHTFTVQDRKTVTSTTAGKWFHKFMD